MLVDPSIVPRPGANGTASGACELDGVSHEKDGPYAVVLGRFYSRPAVRALAKSLDLLTHDRAEAKFAELFRDLKAARSNLEGARDEAATLRAERDQLASELAAVTTERDRLERELSETKTMSELVAEYLEPQQKGARR